MKVADGYSFARKVVNVLKDEGLAVADLLVPRDVRGLRKNAPAIRKTFVHLL